MYPNMFRRRRANKKMGMGRRVSCPHFLVSEGTRRASDGPRTARSKGPAICRKAGRGVTLRRRAYPATRRQSCRLCRPRRRFYRRRVRTPYALLAFLPFIAPNGAERQKQHIYASFYDGKMVKSRFRKMVKISILQKRIFCVHIWAYFGAKRRQFSAVYHVA